MILPKRKKVKESQRGEIIVPRRYYVQKRMVTKPVGLLHSINKVNRFMFLVRFG